MEVEFEFSIGRGIGFIRQVLLKICDALGIVLYRKFRVELSRFNYYFYVCQFSEGEWKQINDVNEVIYNWSIGYKRLVK